MGAQNVQLDHPLAKAFVQIPRWRRGILKVADSLYGGENLKMQNTDAELAG